MDVGGATVDLPNRAGSAPLAIAAGVVSPAVHRSYLNSSVLQALRCGSLQ
jgi:hypothetical protein